MTLTTKLLSILLLAFALGACGQSGGKSFRQTFVYPIYPNLRPYKRGLDSGTRSFVSVGDPPALQIVRRKLESHSIAQQDANIVFAHLARWIR